MAKQKWFKWIVEFQVQRNWVEDGFDLDNETAKDMIENHLAYSVTDETRARVIKHPDSKAIKEAQAAE